MKTTSLRLAMLTLGIRQADVIRCAEATGIVVYQARISKIANGKIYGTASERSAIVRTLVCAGMNASDAWDLLPTKG